MADNVTDLVFNGDSAACLLEQIFVPDITLAKIRCEACDCVNGVGALSMCAGSMGAVVRCVDCGSVLIRAVETPHGLWLEMRGARYLKF